MRWWGGGAVDCATGEAPERDDQASWLIVSGVVVAVIEDEHAVRRILVRILERAGFAPLPFASADEYVSEMASGGTAGVKLVVTDVMMPGTHDGLGLARLIGDSAEAVPVIVMSADPQAVEVAAGIPGVVGILRKPFRMDLLVDLARDVVEP